MTKVPLTITLVALGSALIIGLVVIKSNWTRQWVALESQTLALARATAVAGRTPILNRDVWALYSTLKYLQERDPASAGAAPAVEAAFLDADGKVMAHSDPARHPVGLPFAGFDDMAATRLDHVLKASTAHLLPPELRTVGYVDAVAPISVDGMTVGFLLLRSSTANLTVQVRKDSVIVLAFALGLALIMSIFGTLISRRMVAPLRDLTEGLDAVGRGDLHRIQPVAALNRDEIGHLTEQFNQMVTELMEKKRLEKDLVDAERLAGLGRFAAGLAHEVNNPLGGMLNCVNMLERHPEDAELVRKYVPLLETGLSRISATMQALLGELRGENQTRLCKVGCLTDLEGMVRSEISDRPISLDWNIHAGDLHGAAIVCTCPHIHQIVMNLARNAIAVMPDGGRLAVSSRRQDDELVIEVTDTGPGLDDKARGQLFEPFYTTSHKGTGLGLWITYRLIERMGGRINVTSAPGQGAQFTVTLPLTKVAGPAAPGKEDKDRAA